MWKEHERIWNLMQSIQLWPFLMFSKDNTYTSDVLQILKDKNILYVTVPNNCTDRLQPLDLSVNKAVKQYFRTRFQEWYGSVIYKQLQDGIEEEVDLILIIMKPLSAQWMLECYCYLVAQLDLAINGFKAAEIEDTYTFA